MRFSRKGQSTVEYLLLFTCVVTVIIFFVAQPGSPYQARLNQTYDHATNTLVTTANSFYNSF
ncbi:MAG: hypothetical protein KA403_03015 [Candidatus Omnitrophica bacterium]|nr:hypothetical protein [Candidatus Omnitrophota bacterium]